MENCCHILSSGLTELNLPQTPEQMEQLLGFIKLIAKWNKAYNLTAVRNNEEMARLHILDSLAILPYINGQSVIDIGTGAGLPGIPLAIYLPDIEFILLDSNAKKTRFVQQVILELKLKNVHVIHSRAEDYQPEQGFDTIITRAFASLPDIIKLTAHLLSHNGILLAMKGQIPEIELAQVNGTVIPVKVPELDADRCLVRITM